MSATAGSTGTGSARKAVRDGLSLPVFCAPMFLCSSAALASECCKAGIVGSLTSAQYREDAEFERELSIIRDNVTRFSDGRPGAMVGPLAVAVTLRDMEQFRRQVETCQKYGVRIIVTAFGDPSSIASVVHDLGMLHFHDVINVRFAEKAAAAGVDGMVAIGAGGGGHSGTVSHLAFIPMIRSMFDGIVAMAGAVSNGAVIRAAEILGADLAYMGTRFIATRESGAPDAYKTMLVESGIEDVIYTRGVNGLPASWLKKSLRSAGLDPDNLFIPNGRSTEHLPAGKMPWRDIWSGGQGVGLIHNIPTTAFLVRQLEQEYVEACRTQDLSAAAERALEHVSQVLDQQ